MCRQKCRMSGKQCRSWSDRRLCRLIWVDIVCSRLSVRIMRVSTVAYWRHPGRNFLRFIFLFIYSLSDFLHPFIWNNFVSLRLLEFLVFKKKKIHEIMGVSSSLFYNDNLVGGSHSFTEFHYQQRNYYCYCFSSSWIRYSKCRLQIVSLKLKLSKAFQKKKKKKNNNKKKKKINK